MSTAQEFGQKILELRKQISSATKLRADAAASLEVAIRQREDVISSLKDMGIEPDNAEQELTALEAQLEKSISELSQALNAEVLQYNEILTKTKASLGAKP